MDQLRFYKYATWGLLLLNVGVLAFFLLTMPKPPPASTKAFLSEAIEILRLDAEQEATFRQMARAHNEKMKSLAEEQQRMLFPYFESLVSATENLTKDSMLNQCQQLESQKIEVTYQHFQEIKSNLNKEHLAYFEEFMSKAVNGLLLKNKKSSPPPAGF